MVADNSESLLLECAADVAVLVVLVVVTDDTRGVTNDDDAVNAAADGIADDDRAIAVPLCSFSALLSVGTRRLPSSSI